MFSQYNKKYFIGIYFDLKWSQWQRYGLCLGYKSVAKYNIK